MSVSVLVSAEVMHGKVLRQTGALLASFDRYLSDETRGRMSRDTSRVRALAELETMEQVCKAARAFLER